ncbi:MAG: ABC transporter substrate-binding protein [Anaerolineae bacterium]|nr:ABC transporter substrate-binding protein [Anaerolineae bacterium]
MCERFCRLALGIAVVFLASACNNGTPEPQERQFTVGILNSVSTVDVTIDAFKETMTGLGYVEGRNVTYFYEGAVQDEDALRATAEDYVDKEVDLMVSLINSPTTIAKAVTNEAGGDPIPVVFGTVIDPDASGLVESLQKPGGNLTGVSTGFADVAVAQRLDWLVKAAPGTERVLVPFGQSGNMPAILSALENTAQALGVELVLAEVNAEEDVVALLSAVPEDIDAMLYIGGRAFTTGRADLFALAYERKVPVAVNSVNLIDDGVLLAFGPDSAVIGAQMARLADLVLEGADPGSLPVEAPEMFLTVNLKAADALGIEVPDDVLEAASTILRAEE